MHYLQCDCCRQRFYTGARASYIAVGCLLCGGILRPTDRSVGRPAVIGSADQRPPLPLASLPLLAADPGSYPEARTCYRSVSEFSRSEVSRIHSRERDFGLRWRDETALYRAAWIEATDEFYIVQLGAPSDGGGHVELLGVVGLERLEVALAGWSDMVDQPNSLHWLRERTSRQLGSAAAVGLSLKRHDVDECLACAEVLPGIAPHE